MKKFNFTQPFAMKCDAEQFESVKNELEGMGYVCEDIIEHGDLHIITNYRGNNKDIAIMSINFANLQDYPRIVIETFNRDLCLALAVMTDKPDGMVGEWWMCNIGDNTQFIKDKLYQQNGVIGNFPQFVSEKDEVIACDVTKCFRKASADELIKQFTDEKPFILPKKWYCPYENREQFEVMKKHFGKDWSYCQPNGFNGCSNDSLDNNWNYDFITKRKIKITFDQFMKHVVGESKSEPAETETENDATVFGNNAKSESIEVSKSDRDYIESLNLWIKKQKLCNELKYADIKHEKKSIKLRKKILKASIADYEIEFSRLTDAEIMLSEFKALHNID